MAFIYAAIILFLSMGARGMDAPLPKSPRTALPEDSVRLLHTNRASFVRDLLIYLEDPSFEKKPEFKEFLAAILTGDMVSFERIMQRTDINLFARDGAGRTAFFYAIVMANQEMIDALMQRGPPGIIMNALYNSTLLRVAVEAGDRAFVIERMRQGAEAAYTSHHYGDILHILELFKYFQMQLGLWEILSTEKKEEEVPRDAKILGFEREMINDILAGRELSPDHVREVLCDLHRILQDQKKLDLFNRRMFFLLMYTILYDLPNSFDFLVHFSIQGGNGVTWLDDDNRSLLFYATVFGNVAMVRTLIEEGAGRLINYRDNHGVTPLHVAVLSGSYATVLFLIIHGADPESSDNTGITPLALAQANGFAGMIDLFNDVRPCRFTPLAPSDSLCLSEEIYTDTAQPLEHPEQAQQVSDLGNEDEFFENYHLTPAFRAHLVRSLRSMDGPVDHSPVASSVVRADATNPLKEDLKILEHFCELEVAKIERSLAESRLGCQNSAYENLLEMIRNGDFMCVQDYLLNHRYSVDPAGDEGSNAETASKKSFLDILMLMEEINARRLLHHVIAYGHDEIARLLLTFPGHLDSLDSALRTPLFYAVSTGNLMLVQLLLERGASVEICDIDGNTPLHQAVHLGYIEIAACLIAYGAPLDVLNRIEQTALDRADAMMQRLLTIREIDSRRVVEVTLNRFQRLRRLVFHSQQLIPRRARVRLVYHIIADWLPGAIAHRTMHRSLQGMSTFGVGGKINLSL